MEMNMPSNQLYREKVVLKAGTIIKVGGFPFRLLSDVEVEGCANNFVLANIPLGPAIASGATG